MATMTFRVNDASTDSTNPSVWATITETSNGALSFTITQENGVIGDLRGVFFDVADESLLSTLKVNANSSDIRIGDDLIRDLGDGSNMNGLTGSDKGYDVGIEIGTAGIGKDDIQGYTFTLSSTARNLTLADFSQVDFGVRLTSVGMISGKRVDSSKLLENTSIALQLANVDAQLSEDTTTSGNVLSGLQLLGSTQITGWNGNAVGSQLVLTSENDTVGVVTLNYDGSYTIDTSMADELSANESIIFDLAYSAKNQDEATSWSTDSASFSIAITGTNDSPVADDDDTGAVSENSVQTGNVLANDSDIDRLDTIQVASLEGGALGEAILINNGAGANFKLNANGSYILDSSTADALSEGETITQSFTYTLTDNHNATDTATIAVKITGQNDAPEANDDDTGAITENGVRSGNVLVNDRDIDRLDTIQVTSWEEGALGESVLISNGAGASFTLNADGSYSLDSANADALSEGETITQSFTYTLTDNHDATDTATIAVKITGQNDAPEAGDDDTGAITENGVRSGNVLVNDSDIDRLDTLSISAINNATIEPGGSISVELASGAIVTMFANGDYHYDTNGAFTGLLASETSGDSFTYTVSDGHGGFDTAVVNLEIRGEGSDDLPVVDTPIDNDSLPTDMFPAMAQDIGNVVLYLNDGNSATGIMKIKLQPEGLSIRDVDDLKIFDFIQDHAGLLNGNSQLVGISIHAGQEYPNLAGTDMTAQGEGPFFFLLDGESSAAEAISTRGDHGWTMNWENDDIPLTADAIAMGLNYSLLASQAQTVFTHFNGDMWSL